jgi:hypothetical protein
MNFKEGVDHSDMSVHLTKHYDLIDRIHHEHAGRDGYVASAREGEHMKGSKHYTGEAIDLRTRDLDKETRKSIVEDLRHELGNDYDVILESNHIHVEYDPEMPPPDAPGIFPGKLLPDERNPDFLPR